MENFKCSIEGCDKICKTLGYLKLHLMKKHGFSEDSADFHLKENFGAITEVPESDGEYITEDDVNDNYMTKDESVGNSDIFKTPIISSATPEEQDYEKQLDNDLRLARKELVLARLSRRTREFRDKPHFIENNSSNEVVKLISMMPSWLQGIQKETLKAFTDQSAMAMEQAEIENAPKDALSQVMDWALKNPTELLNLIQQFIPIKDLAKTIIPKGD